MTAPRTPENLFSHRAGRSEPTQKQKMPASNPGTQSVTKRILGRAVRARPQQRTPSARRRLPRAALTCAGDSGRVRPGAGAVVL